MQLDTEDIACLEKLGFIVEPALPADKKSRFKQIVQNPFIHLEDIRFWGVKFVRFPDQQRRLIHERSICASAKCPTDISLYAKKTAVSA